MIRFSCRASVVILILNLCAPTFLCPQPRIVIRPKFDETLLHQGLYPHKVPTRPRVALVLSGGGARGVAQIGVLKSLERHKIPVDLIVATSLGAVVGGLYASGYTPDELERLALTTNWDELLSLSGETRRRDLFIDQKIADDRSFFAIRFQGLEPVIPSAISSGQRLTDFLSTQTLQALYHPDPSFDDLKIRFRSVTTDLISGKRVILKEGSLSEALRASATVPLLFSPIEKDSMQLIDGGLVSNIPVDVARSEGYDVVIAVNSTSGMRNKEELKAPWQAADQIMGIMMQTANEQQLKLADVIITPEIGRHLSSDFSGLDSLIRLGEAATENTIGAIESLFTSRYNAMMKNDGNVAGSDSVFNNVAVVVHGAEVPDSLRAVLQSSTVAPFRLNDIRKLVNEMYDGGEFLDVWAEVELGADSTIITYHLEPNALLRDVRIGGHRLLSADVLQDEFLSLHDKPLNPDKISLALESMLRLYRSKGYSLARLDSVRFDSASGVLDILINEGIVDRIDVQGGVRTEDYFVLREFPLEEGDVFEIGKANAGLVNINSTKLFDYVYLEVSYPGNKPLLTVRLKERPSQLVRLGIRADNERYMQGSLDIRDENFHGTGSQLGFTVAGGGRNREFMLEYKTFRIFNTYLTFGVSAFHSLFDTDVYGDVAGLGPNRFDRERLGEYRDVRTGGRLVFGSQLERLGNATIEFSVQNARIKNLENMESLAERYLLTLLKIGTTIDTKDVYPFPTSGIGFQLGYEIASKRLGSEVSYNALRVMYESYSSWGGQHTLHPKVTLGVADRTTPLGQQFRFGGQGTFFGLHEDDRRGRQMLLINLEYRYRLPIRILFDTYLGLRYDLGSISLIPEEIKLSTFRHGLGAELALDTPIGAALFGIGKSFYFVRDLPQNPVQQGPFMLYFTIGYDL